MDLLRPRGLEDMVLLMQTDSRLAYLKASSIDVFECLLGLFRRLLGRIEINTVFNFLTELQESDCLRDSFQLAICLGQQDLDACLAQININRANKNFDRKQLEYRNEYYNGLLKRLFNYIIDLKHDSNKEVKRFLNPILKEKHLRIVSSSYNVFEETEVITISTDTESDEDEDQEEVKENTNKPELIENHSERKLAEFIKSKCEPFTALTNEHLIQLEKAVWCSSDKPRSNINALKVGLI